MQSPVVPSQGFARASPTLWKCLATLPKWLSTATTRYKRKKLDLALDSHMHPLGGSPTRLEVTSSHLVSPVSTRWVPIVTLKSGKSPYLLQLLAYISGNVTDSSNRESLVHSSTWTAGPTVHNDPAASSMAGSPPASVVRSIRSGPMLSFLRLSSPSNIIHSVCRFHITSLFLVNL
jgi:hypothetical protein